MALINSLDHASHWGIVLEHEHTNVQNHPGNSAHNQKTHNTQTKPTCAPSCSSLSLSHTHTHRKCDFHQAAIDAGDARLMPLSLAQDLHLLPHVQHQDGWGVVLRHKLLHNLPHLIILDVLIRILHCRDKSQRLHMSYDVHICTPWRETETQRERLTD